MAPGAGGKQKPFCQSRVAALPSQPADQHFGKWGSWQLLQKFLLVLPTVLWVATGGLARKQEVQSNNAESNCPTESGWEEGEEVSRGQGRERDLSGRAKMPASSDTPRWKSESANLRWEWAGLAGTKDEREACGRLAHTHPPLTYFSGQ